MKKSNGKGFEPIPNMRCEYCGAPVVRKSADGIYRENSRGVELYVCSNYPRCDAYVRVEPNTGKPVGTLANARLRKLRSEAHKSFDRLHLSGLMSKNEAYAWLAALLQAPMKQAHIGYLGEYYCQVVIDESRRLLSAHRLRTDSASFRGGALA